MDNRQLTFSGNFQGINPYGSLIIRKGAPISLKPWIEDLFGSRDRQRSTDENYLIPKERWEEREQDFKVNFHLNDFLQTFSGEYKLDELIPFFESHLEDPQDFQNEVMISRLRYFNEVGGLVQPIFVNGYFFLRPRKNLTVEEITNIAKPARKIKSKIVKYSYFDLNPERLPNNESGKQNTTYGYEKSSYRNVIDKIESNREKMIICPHISGFQTSLNYFYFISRYRLPTSHLEISLKNQP